LEQEVNTFEDGNAWNIRFFGPNEMDMIFCSSLATCPNKDDL